MDRCVKNQIVHQQAFGKNKEANQGMVPTALAKRNLPLYPTLSRVSHWRVLQGKVCVIPGQLVGIRSHLPGNVLGGKFFGGCVPHFIDTMADGDPRPDE